MATADDDFVRANDPDDLGAEWTVDEGELNIVSNRAECIAAVSTNRARYTNTAMDTSDHFAQADIQEIGGGATPDAGATARQASSTETYYAGWYVETNNGTNGIRIFKVIAGSFTELAAVGSNATVERTIKIEVSGTGGGASQELFVDGSSVASSSDTAISSGTFVGISGNNIRGSFNNWSAGDLAVAGGLKAGSLALMGVGI